MSVIVIDPCHSPWSLEFVTSLTNDINDQVLTKQQHPILGFDMEWTTVLLPPEPDEPKGKRVASKVAVMQIATEYISVVIRWVNVMKKLEEEQCPIATKLVESVTLMLNDVRITKVGAGIRGDRNKIHGDYGIDVHPCVDLGVLRKFVIPEEPHALTSLKQLSLDICGEVLGKETSITLSDWANGAVPLTAEQVHYAATDALLSYRICHTLMTKYLSRIGDGAAAVNPLVALVGRSPSHGHNSSSGTNSGGKSKPAVAPVGRLRKYYHNIRVLGPQDEFLFTIDDYKEAEWYVHKKGLGTVTNWRINEHGKKEIAEIKLLNAPDPSTFHDGALLKTPEYAQAEKENICVVCGSEGPLVRHSVIPATFRKRFPARYVRHNNFDILLVCVVCAPIANEIDLQEKKKVAEEYAVVNTQTRRSVNKATNALVRHRTGRSTLPAEREETLGSTVKQALAQQELDIEEDDAKVIEGDPLSDEALRILGETTKFSLGDSVMDRIIKDAKRLDEEHEKQHGALPEISNLDILIGDFMVRWRSLFVDKLKPKHLPKGWGIHVGILNSEDRKQE